jgi:tetratricopeptide (TPR) repeat protein
MQLPTIQIGMKHFAAFATIFALVLLTSCRPSPEKLLASANKYHQNKKYKEASILYQKVINKDKKNAEAYYREGLNLLDEGSPVEASQYLRRAIDLKPDNTDAESKLAEIYLTAYLSNQKRFKALLSEIEDLKAKILQQNPNSFSGLRLQALLELADHKTDEALADFQKANKIEPHSRQLVGWYAQALLAAGHPDQAEALVRDMLNHDKAWGPGYDFLFLLYGRNKEPQKQEAVLRERVTNEPTSPVAITNLSDYLLATGRYDEANGLIKRVLDDRKAFPSAREMVGNFYVRAKKYDEAIQQYRTGASEDPSHALAYNQRIVAVYTIMGKRDEALQMAKSLAAKNPKDTLSNEMYASLLLDTGLHSDVTKSLAELNNLVKNNPTNPVLHLDLARASMATNDGNKALSETLEALQDEAKSNTPRPSILIPGRIIAARIYESRGQHAQALEQSNQVLKLQEGNPQARLARDQALIGLNEADQAVPDLESFVQQYPKGPESNEARLALGNVYLHLNRIPQAVEQFQRVWTSTPPDVRGFMGLQQAKIAQGKPDEAVHAMADLVSKNPNALNLRYQLASFETTAGRMALKSNPDQAKTYFQQAADNYKEILKTTVNSADVWVRLGNLQRELGQNDAALASFEQATNADGHNTEALLARAVLLDGMGKKKEAADFYNRVLGIDPNNAPALNNLAFLNADSDTNLDQAMTFAERAKKQAPQSLDISDTLGYVYYRKNLNAAALDIFRQDVQDQPQNPTFHLHLAMALLKNGDKQGAREEAQKALKNAAPAQQSQIKSFVGQIG